MTRAPCVAGLLVGLFACKGQVEAEKNQLAMRATATPSASAEAAVGAVPAPEATLSAASSAPRASSGTPAPSAPFVPAPERYAWLAGDRDFPKPDATLESRFPTPPGYARVQVEAGSFAEWLRGLPMAPEGTEARRYDGTETLSGEHDYLAGVIAIDIGSSDLQQSSDVIVRLHAEYLWSRGDRDKISYLSATKLEMPLSRWEKGQRLIPNGANVFWAVKGKPAEIDHAEFRRYLDAVFNWANSTSLSARSTAIADPKELRAGDFFMQSKAPSHVAVVLDVAEKPSGERVVLLGQARNPAESMHVVRPGKATAWFSARPEVPVMTPHSKALAWEELRRLAPAEPEK